MRDAIFLLADSNMEATFVGFLTRDGYHHSLQCRPIEFDPRVDIIVDAGGNDPGVYTRAHELLRPFSNTHRYAVIVLDSEWEGSPGTERIRQHISDNLLRSGWDQDRFVVIVIDPELEAWIWINSLHVAQAFQFSTFNELRELIIGKGLWKDGAAKPMRPKEAIELALRQAHIPRSSAIYKNIISHASIIGCSDASFRLLRRMLIHWFPLE